VSNSPCTGFPELRSYQLPIVQFPPYFFCYRLQKSAFFVVAIPLSTFEGIIDLTTNLKNKLCLEALVVSLWFIVVNVGLKTLITPPLALTAAHLYTQWVNGIREVTGNITVE
jgi:hypothetical protein